MKANHNDNAGERFTQIVVVNISKSKNESKSQLPTAWAYSVPGCGKNPKSGIEYEPKPYLCPNQLDQLC